tara:strand:- start:932 stop:1837 length:906 start_codon:yes stop_codon:yes gene_type:complete
MECLSGGTEENIIIKAEHIHKEHYYKVRSRENICKIKITNEEGQIYYIELIPESDFWKENNKYFQNNLNKFSDLINDTLVLETGDITFKIIKEDIDEIVLRLTYQGLFGFECFLAIPRKKDRVDILDGEIQDLQRLNEEKDKKIIDLEARLKWVEDIIHMNLELREFHNGPFVNFPDKEYSKQWPPLKYSILGKEHDWKAFDYCCGINGNYNTDHQEVQQIRTDVRNIVYHLEDFRKYLQIYKDPDHKLEHPQQYQEIHKVIPWAGAKKIRNMTGRYEFKDLPKWLDFLEKWKERRNKTNA